MPDLEGKYILIFAKMKPELPEAGFSLNLNLRVKIMTCDNANLCNALTKGEEVKND